MPATASRIGFILTDFRRAVATTDSAKSRYGNLARETEDPVETYFDNEADALVIAQARQALLSVERRRFRLMLRDADEIRNIALAPTAPVARFTDTEKGADLPCIVSEIVIDLGRDAAQVTLWG